MYGKNHLFQKKINWKTFKNRPTTAIASGGGEACGLTDILGTSSMGKEMEALREGWLFVLIMKGGKK